MCRPPAPTQSCGLPRTVASRQWRPHRGLEHLAIAPLYRPKRQARLIPLQPIVPQLNPRPTPRPPLAPTGRRSRTLGRKRIVRRQRSRTLGRKQVVRRPSSRALGRKRIVHRPSSRTLGRKRTGMSLGSGRKLLHRASARRPSATLLLRRRRMQRRSKSVRSPGRRRQKRRSSRTNSQSRTRNRRSKGRVLDQTAIYCSGHPQSSEGALFLSPGAATRHGL